MGEGAPRWGWVWPSVHPSLLLVAGLAVVAGRGRDLAVIFASVLAHELAHLVVGGLFGLRPQRITLYPFGGVAELSGLEGASPPARLVTLAAGPLASLLLVLVGGLLGAWAGGEPPAALWLESLERANLGLLAANLLPVGPLDGGRMVEVVVERWVGVGVARRWLMRAGVAAGGVLVLAGLAGVGTGRPWGGLVLLGSFLAVAARREDERTPYAVLRWCLRGPRAVSPGLARLLAAPAGARVRDVANWLGPGPYRLVAVVAPKGQVLGFLGEGEIVEALARGAGEARLDRLVGSRPPPRGGKDRGGEALAGGGEGVAGQGRHD